MHFMKNGFHLLFCCSVIIPAINYCPVFLVRWNVTVVSFPFCANVLEIEVATSRKLHAT